MEMGYTWLCIRTAKKSLDERMRYRKRKSLDNRIQEGKKRLDNRIREGKKGLDNRIREGKKAWMKGYDTEKEEPG